jgi:Family of unknown function (DUF6011)
MQIKDAKTAMAFLLAGRAHVTFVSTKTGTRFTYRVAAAAVREGHPFFYFVSVLTAPEHYEYLGVIHGGRLYSHGKKSRIGREAPSAKAFQWSFAQLSSGRMPSLLDVYHEGRCGRCGRQLTTPESIERGLGPECAQASAVGR